MFVPIPTAQSPVATLVDHKIFYYGWFKKIIKLMSPIFKIDILIKLFSDAHK